MSSPHPLFLRSALLLSAFALTPFAARGAGAPAGDDFARAREVLSRWENTDPVRATRRVHVVYWTPADTEPAPRYRERLTRVLRYAQDFYARQMTGYGFGPRSIRLQLEADGLLTLPVVRGSKPFADYARASGGEIRRDCVAALKARGVDADAETLVIFCNLSKWDPVARTMVQTSPYYAAGTHREGVAWQVDSPLLDPALIGVKDRMLRDGEYGHVSEGRYNSIFVGGVVHELGHALGMPHCSECPTVRAARGRALMGAGNRTMGEQVRGEGPGTFLSEGHALKLAAHPQFSGSVKAIDTPAKVDWSGLSLTPSAGGVAISGRVAANLPVHAVLAYADPEGGGDYDATLAHAVPDAAGRFTLQARFNAETKARRGEIRLVAVCANGAATAYAYPNAKPAYPYAIRPDGTADLAAAAFTLAVEDALRLKATGRLDAAALATLPAEVRALLARLDRPDTAAGRPKLAAAAGAVALADVAPDGVAVGYDRIHFDRSGSGEPIRVGGAPCPTAVYAHADSTLTYAAGGRWRRFTGKAGLPDDAFGKVVFSVVADGREVWRSGVMKAGAPVAFDVDLGGAATVELRVRAKDGNIGGAGAAWVECVFVPTGDTGAPSK